MCPVPPPRATVSPPRHSQVPPTPSSTSGAPTVPPLPVHTPGTRMTGCATRAVRVTRGCPPAGGWCPPPTLGDNGDGDTPCRANFQHRDPAPGGHHGLGAFWGQGSCCAQRARSGHGDLRGWGLFRHKAPPLQQTQGSPRSGCCKDTGTPLILSTHSIRARGSQQGRGYRVRGGPSAMQGGRTQGGINAKAPPSTL